MRGIQILSAPLAIAIDDEPLDGVDRGDWPVVSADGFGLIPAWRSRPAARGLRVGRRGRHWGLAAAVALSGGRGQDAAPMRPSSATPLAPAGPALVVQASPASATDASRAAMTGCRDARGVRC